MSKFKRIFIIALLLCFVFVGFITLNTTDQSAFSPTSGEANKQVHLNQITFKDESADKSDIEIPETAKLYKECSNFKDDFRKSESDWLKNKKPDWASFLIDGYSVDEITTTVEYFQNSNFAVSFRVEQLRNNSILVKDNHSLMQQVKSLFPDIFEKGSPFSVTKRVPQSALENFDALSSTQKNSLLNSNKPSIDDVAYFINDKNYSNDDVLLLLSKLQDPSAVVGYGKLDAISLIDYAAFANRAEVVEYLLDLGVNITEDAYLGSTMDWALKNLMNAVEAQSQQDAVKIVKLIWNNGGRANFIEPLENGIEGSFPRGFFRFSNEDIDLLQQRYGIDLRLIEQRNTLKVNKDSQLIRNLRKSREDYLVEVLGRDNTDDFRLECKNIVANLNGIWNPSSIYNVIEANIKENDSPEAIKAALAAIDPILVDRYLKQTLTIRNFSFVSGLDEIFRKVGKSTIFEIIDEVLALGLSDKENSYVVIQLLGFDSSYFDELKYSGLMTQEPSYSDYKGFNLIKLRYIKPLYESGANLTAQDTYGKTLTYYAAKNHDLALLKYMSDENFPYQLSNIGEDPLHALLQEDSQSSRTNPFYIYDAVVALMEFKPEIDEFHLSRMALLKYTAPYNYLKILQQYPKLEPKADTPLPSIRFSCFSPAQKICN
jgi:hypothetical protein